MIKHFIPDITDERLHSLCAKRLKTSSVLSDFFMDEDVKGCYDESDAKKIDQFMEAEKVTAEGYCV